MRKKILVITMSTILAASLLAGCGSSTENENSEVVSIISEDPAEETTVSGTVTKITDSTISVDGTAYELADEVIVTREMSSGNPDGENTDMGEASEKPEGENSDMGTAGEAPEKPEGESSDMGTNGEAPEKPEGDGSMGEGGAMEAAELTLADISVGDEVELTLNEEGKVTAIAVLGGSGSAGMGQPGGQSSGVTSYSALYEYTEDTEIDGETVTSAGTDENAILVSGGANVTLSNVTVDRTSEDSTGGDNSSFYGVGAAILTTDGTTTISNAVISTDAKGGAGVFAYGDGVVYISDSTITTTEDTSGGIHVAGGGTLYADNVTAETDGESSAAIRSDRGGGTMVVNGGSYTSNGTGSPAVYCTADITISDAELTATGSEAVCIEGFNSLTLTDCDLSGDMSDDENQNDCTWNVILYQSMSGDSEVGNSTFSMTGGTLTAGNGGMFYTTNTESTFILENVDITYAEENDFFLRCTGNNNARGWGSVGSNGADCTFTGISQQMEGDVIWDSVSTLKLSLTEGSTLTGAITDDESCAGNGGNGSCTVSIDAESEWIVTGDSVVTTLENEGSIVDSDGNTVSVVGSDGTVYVSGSSSYTVTVDNYS